MFNGEKYANTNNRMRKKIDRSEADMKFERCLVDISCYLRR